VLEEDPILFSLDDEKIDEVPETSDERVKDLEARLLDLGLQFQEYKAAVSESFAKNLVEKSASVEAKSRDEKEKPRDDDSHYFNSYAGNGEFLSGILERTETDGGRYS